MRGLMAELPWSDAFEQLLRSHCGQLDPASPIDPDSAFVALGVDSYDLLHLVLDCEKSFAVEFSDDKLTEEFFATPRTFWRALQELLAEAAGPGIGSGLDAE
jgi:acyl carrier protein